MARQWLRRVRLLAACASVLAMVACGGGETESELDPQRVVTFGDGFADVGQNGRRYTVNDSSINNWTQAVADEFDLTLAPSSAGGLSYASGNARVAATPDAAGNAATPTVQQQIATFLAAGGPRDDDLLIVNAGTSDVIVQAQSVLGGTSTEMQARERIADAGRELAEQVKRLVAAGAEHVVVVGPYNLGVSAWVEEDGNEESMEELLEKLSREFNDELKVSLVDYGNTVLYVDAALYFNLMAAAPGAYDMEDDMVPVCTSVDPGAGIGTGAGQVNSNLCTSATIRTGVDYDRRLFADRVYPTPAAHRHFGDYAVDRIRDRW